MSRGGPAAEFLRGALCPLRGFLFILARPAFWPWAFAPFFLSLLLYAGLLWGGWRVVHPWLSENYFTGDGYWAVLGGLLAVVYWAGLLLVSAIFFIPLSALIASPFNEVLSEKTERALGAAPPDSGGAGGISGLIRGAVAGMAGEARRGATMLGLSAGALTLNLIPPPAGQTLAAGVSVLIAMLYLALEYTSASMDRRGYSWSRKRAYLAAHRARTFGFGASAFLILMTPFLNVLFIPAAAVAGTILFVETEGRRAAPPAGEKNGAGGKSPEPPPLPERSGPAT